MPKAASKKSRKSPAKSPRAAPVRPSFASVAVVVSDRHKAVAWYTEKFGLKHTGDFDHWQTVGAKGGAVLHLCQVTEYDPKGQLEPGNTGIHFHLPGKDFVAACHALKANGVEFSSEPEKYDWGWGAIVRDPDGNEIYLSPE